MIESYDCKILGGGGGGVLVLTKLCREACPSFSQRDPKVQSLAKFMSKRDAKIYFRHFPAFLYGMQHGLGNCPF